MLRRCPMRAACALLLVFCIGCSNTIRRLDGEVSAPAGPARTPCEKNAWLVMAPTRYEQVQPDGRTTRACKDGIGLYRVGASEPVSIPDAADDLGPSPLLKRHERGVREYDRDRMIAASLGVGGLIAITLGTALFVTSFETVRSSGGEEEQRINGPRATWGGIAVGVGFGLSIAGLVLNPSHAERARAEATRYVFVPPKDDEREVSALVKRHNKKVRRSCQRIEGPAGAASEDEFDSDDELDDAEEEVDDTEGDEDAAEDDEDLKESDADESESGDQY
jgi:hypothetical protein